MPRTTNSKINNFFSFSTGVWLNWSDEPRPEPREEETETESESDQSIDSDHSSDFWYHWSPVIDKMIIARRATYLKELENNIKTSAPKITKYVEQNRFKNTIVELELYIRNSIQKPRKS